MTKPRAVFLTRSAYLRERLARRVRYALAIRAVADAYNAIADAETAIAGFGSASKIDEISRAADELLFGEFIAQGLAKPEDTAASIDAVDTDLSILTSAGDRFFVDETGHFARM